MVKKDEYGVKASLRMPKRLLHFFVIYDESHKTFTDHDGEQK
jgi:hypothetical protein